MLAVYDLVISPRQTVRDALERMTRNKKGLLFVCNEGAHMVGVVSDGDIRRALVENAMMLTPIKSIMNLDPIFATSTEEARWLLDNQSLLAVPVLDDKGRITQLAIRQQDEITIVAHTKREFDNEQEHGLLETAAIIPARGGSKRVEKKNIALLARKPLLAYAVEAAQAARYVGQVLVSTDDPEIASVAREYGAEVPWMRPAHLAQDHTPSLDVVLHATRWIVDEQGNGIAYGVLLEPTAPLRTSEQIDRAIEMLHYSDADAVVSVSLVPHVLNPEELLVIQDNQLTPYIEGKAMDNRWLRGQQRPVYVQNGLVYAFRLQSLLEKKSLYGNKTLPLVVGWDYFLDVDTPADLQRADWAIRQLIIDL